MHTNLLDTAKLASSGAAELLKRAYREDAGIESEYGRDIKTQADVAAQHEIFKVLEDTGIPILSEEDEDRSSIDPSGTFWVVDPLDGTFNFSRGLPFCGVSIGLWQAGEPVLGVIEDLGTGDILAGEVASGATLNERPIAVSSINDPAKGALATGFPAGRNYSTDSLQTTLCGIQAFKKVRMLGSAALALAAVACGRVDAYWEENIWLWDVAAGLALVKAAGGDFRTSRLSDDWNFDVFAHNGHLENFGGEIGFSRDTTQQTDS